MERYELLAVGIGHGGEAGSRGRNGRVAKGRKVLQVRSTTYYIVPMYRAKHLGVPSVPNGAILALIKSDYGELFPYPISLAAQSQAYCRPRSRC
jgi:hypothetical protein